ncbi:MAG: biosynthetic-type acetolactate synthase large subunit [Chloroflexi bacterium]|nr:biosynthetic-type acetolactate synthase large subunit [Ardenticatenaceae bacterium]MBL1131102.1 biosynthetic-type acetolactate synthase large subunit [Chloroflexota bacterium]NOG37200.1 biosynthetic-type acetolactate synthase large subunit [Chloroflexota bacterium]GIK55264.1 MAG: acetolactate synthase [Chloroflexota bacterium]
MSEMKTGGQIIWESLIAEGVEVVFGLPGGAILPAYDDLAKYEYPIHHVLVTHEQGAAHMADGYARSTGRVGVCIATSGPGATNLVTGLATAYMDSTPIVAITGQVPTSLLGRDGFQEADIQGVTLPVTKHNYLITNIRDLPDALKEAFYIARTGRPGPVLVDVCKDALQASMPFTYPSKVNLPGYNPNLNTPDGTAVARAARLVNEAQRPVIVAGQGVSIARAEAELRQLAEKANIPVATSLLGIGAFPATHPLSISWGGMHGEAYCNYALQECDVLLAVGARLDDRLTGAFDTFAPKAKIIHVDIDPAEMGKNITIDTAVIGDALLALRALLPQVEANEHPAWLEQIAEWKSETSYRDILQQESDELVAPYVMRSLWHATGEGNGRATVVTDVGQHQMWEAQYYHHNRRRSLLTSGGLGTMGYALPAAIGAQMGNPDQEIWVVAGDGGFQMTMMELSTVVQERLPIKIAIINNGYLGMVRQWQDVFYNKRHSGTPLFNPDFVKIAEAYGIRGRSVTRREEAYDAIKEAQAHDGPYLLDFQVEEFTNVYPMVAPGKSNADMIRRPAPAMGSGK